MIHINKNNEAFIYFIFHIDNYLINSVDLSSSVCSVLPEAVCEDPFVRAGYLLRRLEIPRLLRGPPPADRSDVPPNCPGGVLP